MEKFTYLSWVMALEMQMTFEVDLVVLDDITTV